MRIGIAGILNKPIIAGSTGGTEIFTHALSEMLVKRGHDVTLFATSDSKVSAKLISVCSSKDTKGVEEGGIQTQFPYQLLQSKIIAQESSKFDLIHNNYFDSFQLGPIHEILHGLIGPHSEHPQSTLYQKP